MWRKEACGSAVAVPVEWTAGGLGGIPQRPPWQSTPRVPAVLRDTPRKVPRCSVRISACVQAQPAVTIWAIFLLPSPRE